MKTTNVFSETFIRDQGYRLSFLGKSVLLNTLSVAHKLNKKQREGLAQIIIRLFAETNGNTFDNEHTLELSSNEFPIVHGEAYKCVTPEVEQYLRSGRFRLATPLYYSTLSTDPREDLWEGFSSLCIDVDEYTLNSLVRAGYNCLIFCTTHTKSFSELEDLRKKFGGSQGRIVKITDIDGFAKAINQKLSCDKLSIRDVQYRDIKSVYTVNNEYRPLLNILLNNPHPNKNLDRRIINDLNITGSDIVYRDALMGSVFTKPSKYAHEKERRLLLEFSQDINTPYINVFAPEALEFVEFEN